MYHGRSFVLNRASSVCTCGAECRVSKVDPKPMPVKFAARGAGPAQSRDRRNSLGECQLQHLAWSNLVLGTAQIQLDDAQIQLDYAPIARPMDLGRLYASANFQSWQKNRRPLVARRKHRSAKNTQSLQ